MSPTLLRLWALLRTALTWWLRTLGEMVPPRLAEALSGDRDRLIVDIEPAQLIVRHRSGDHLREIARAAIPDVGFPERPAALTRQVGAGAAHAILRLTPDVAVRKLVQLPDTAAPTLRQILEHQLERHTPIEPTQVYFDYTVREHDRAQKRLTVELVMVLRSTIDSVTALARHWALTPHAIGLIEPDTWRARFDFRRPQRDAIRAPARRRLALAMLAVILAIGTAYATLAYRQRQADALEAAVDQMKTQALTASRLRAAIAKRVEQRDFLATKRLESPRVAVLNDVARTLGDDTWLTDLQLAGGKLRIGGYSLTASSLIALLQQRPGFANPHFESPVTRAVTGAGERFDLSVDIVPQSQTVRP